MRVVIAVVLCALAGTASVGSDEAGFTLVVSKTNPLSSVRRQELAKLFLKKSRRFGDGREAVPVDQSLRSPVRTAFTRAVLAVEGMSQTSAVESYWLQQVYSGRGTPPLIKASDKDVVAFVVANQDAIGYVGPGADLAAVKVLSIEQ